MTNSTEIRYTDPNTGGQKGVKLERFDLIPPHFHAELARVYGMGSLKYEPNNWRKGYDWTLSLGALERHINLWKCGEDLDEESDLNHLAHAAWHLYTLYTFHKYGLGTDDIPERQ